MAYRHLVAMNIFEMGEIPYDELSISIRKDHSFPLPPQDDIEKKVIQKDFFDHLSKEARGIMEMIFNAPDEIIQTFTTNTYNKISKRKIKKYLMKNGWRRKEILFSFMEIKQYIRNID